ncbi:hypothetical protein QBC40DRAFT_258111 [Triangularia verruculosa]|uniref:Uncharacterized protein n=1 Tax=Triangularia verruculosa TaxID=2587418 RepID=A0AAN6X911_9PEZI|nr:hypothetical protein QBC40DRAFT_258111 [Triangularia verruculosa]
MTGSVFNWRAIEEAIELNEIVPGQSGQKVFKPIARDVIQELQSNKNIAMTVILHDCQEILKEVNRQYHSFKDQCERTVIGIEFNKLIIKRSFFTFTLGWIEKSMGSQRGSLSTSDVLGNERDWDVVAYHEDWAIIGDADLA